MKDESEDDKITREYHEEARRRERASFVKRIAGAVDPISTGAFPAAEQAATLRKMADQIEREGRGDPVSRSQARVAERDAWPNRQFFQRTPAKPSPAMREKWLAEAQGRSSQSPQQPAPTERKVWNPAPSPTAEPDPNKPHPIQGPKQRR